MLRAQMKIRNSCRQAQGAARKKDMEGRDEGICRSPLWLTDRVMYEFTGQDARIIRAVPRTWLMHRRASIGRWTAGVPLAVRRRLGVVGAAVVGAAVVGAPVAGAPVVGAAVAGAEVEGAVELGEHCGAGREEAGIVE